MEWEYKPLDTELNLIFIDDIAPGVVFFATGAHRPYMKIADTCHNAVALTDGELTTINKAVPLKVYTGKVQFDANDFITSLPKEKEDNPYIY